MPVIKLETLINAPLEIAFDLSRSIDLHKISTAHTKEEAIAGVTSGLIKMGESVTWKARHFGISQRLTSKITVLEKPFYFVDEMTTGAFNSFRHEHIFIKKDHSTLMIDVFDYRSPLGVLGKIADSLFLKRYIVNLLKDRNKVIQKYAEDENLYTSLLDAEY